MLPTYPPDLSAKAGQSVVKLGVEVRTNVKVVGVDRDGVTFQRGSVKERLAARTVLWAAGVVASSFGARLAARTGAETDKAGRIRVNADLTIPGYPNVYVVGDLALSRREDGAQLPGVAQVAMQGGGYAAKAIIHRLRGAGELPPFRYFDKGDMAVIGRAAAVANIFGFHVSGWPAWITWLFIHLMYLVQFQSRILVFIQWGFQYLTFSRGARLITGTADSDLPPTRGLTSAGPLSRPVENCPPPSRAELR